MSNPLPVIHKLPFHLLAAILFLFISVPVAAQKTLVFPGSEYTFHIHLKTYYNDDSTNSYLMPGDVSVYKRPAGEFVQNISLGDAGYGEWDNSSMRHGKTVLFDDVNFDGYQDILIYLGASTALFFNWWALVYDPATKQFVRVKEFEHIYDPEPDAEHKVVHEYIRVGFDYWGHLLWRWEGVKLIPAIEQYDDGNGNITTSRWLNGEWVPFDAPDYGTQDYRHTKCKMYELIK